MDPGVSLRRLVDDLASLILRTIIHNHPFPRQNALTGHTFNRKWQVELLITNRSNDHVFGFWRWIHISWTSTYKALIKILLGIRHQARKVAVLRARALLHGQAV